MKEERTLSDMEKMPHLLLYSIDNP